jgi:O-antigen/teichoic acid export membrane protein
MAEADDGLTGLGRRSALALAGAGVSGVSTIATLVIASRTLSDAGAGEFFVAISIFAIAQGMCSLGIDTGLQYWVPTLQAAAAKRLLRTVIAGSTALGLIIALIVYLSANPLNSILSEGDGDASSMLRTIAIVLPFAGLYEVTMGALRACDQILVAVTLDRIIRPIAQVGAMLAVAYGGAVSTSVAFAWALPNVVSVVVALVLLSRMKLKTDGVGRRPTLTQREFWRYNAPRGVARVAQTLTQRLDVLILAAVVSLDEAGVYGTVSRCMIAGVFVSTAVTQVVQPRLRRLIVRGDMPAVKLMYGASTTWLVIATFPAYIAMAVYAPLVMRAFGSDYERGSHALIVLCLTMLIASACGLVDVVLLMLGRSWLSTSNILLALVLNVILNFALAPHFAMMGSAAAWSVAILANNLLPLYQAWRRGLHPGGEPLYTAMAVSGVTIAIPLLIARVVFGDGLGSFAVAFTVALVLYCASLVIYRRQMLLDRFVSDLRSGRGSGNGGPGQGRPPQSVTVGLQ